jgi:sec-independent protein translocase protein TatC
MPRELEDDLFESTKMTFGEHLEELRVTLFKALIALVIGFAVGLVIAKHVVVWIQSPLQTALQEHYAAVSEDRREALIKKLKDRGDEVPEWLQPSAQAEAHPGMTWDVMYIDPSELVEQLKGAWPEAFSNLAVPEKEANQAAEKDVIELRVGRVPVDDERMMTKSLSVQEPFFVYVKAALVTGIIFSSPLVFFYIWSFVAAGLYPHEKRYVYVFMPFSLALFIAGAALAFFVVLKYVLHFLFGFNAWLGIDPDPRISEWLGFALILPIGFGVSFQLPLVMLFLERIGIFTVKAYLDKWRIAILIIAVMSMLLTPADPSSMVLMALPLTVLYFSGILLCHLMPRRSGMTRSRS